jgi:mannose-1-phosphate guanylyltransferase
MINAGTYILEPEVLGFIPQNTPWSFERKLFPMLLEKGEPVYGYSSDAYWIDIGRPEKYLLVHRDLLTRPSLLSKDVQKSLRNEGARIHPSAKLNGPVVVGAGSEIGPGVSLNGPVVIGPNCVVKDGSVITESIIWQGVHVGPGASIKNSFIADACVLGDKAALDGAILGDHVTAGAGLKIGPGSRLWPGTVANA